MDNLTLHRHALEAAQARTQTACANGDWHAAEQACRQAIELAPGEALLHLQLGEVLLRLCRPMEAEGCYARAAELFPGLGLPFTRLSSIRLRRWRAPMLPREADADRGRLQMTTLGNRGRFGNQLLQYAYARIYADRHGLELEVPDWLGRDLYGHDDPLPGHQLAPLDESQADFGAILRGVPGMALEDRDISGYFCWDTSGWGQAATEFRRLFELQEDFARPLEAEYARLTEGTVSVVAIHLRRGDFGSGRFWVAPTAWYLDWLTELWPSLDRPRLYIATDAPELATGFARFKPILAHDVRVSLPGVEFLVDHFWLIRATHLAISNSTFSFSAAMLNERLACAVRPDPDARKLVPFDPWRAPVLVDAQRQPDTIQPGERTIIERRLPTISSAVHVGRVCSPWTNEVRAVLPRFKVFEMEPAMSLDSLRSERSLLHVEHLRLESAHDLGRVVAGASVTLCNARIDSIEFTIRDGGIGREVAHLVGLGYRLFAADAQGVRVAAEARIRTPGTYMLVHERLLAERPAEGAPLIDLQAEAARHGITLAGRGVLHVGAHEGQEAPYYRRLGMAPVVFVEANPDVYARLAHAVGGLDGVYAVQRAASDRAGQVDLHLASFDQSSSLLPLARHLDVYPGIRPAGVVTVQASPLDDIVRELGLRTEQFSVLHIDVQGAEMLVLRGAEAVLGSVELVSVEVNFDELYRGGAQIEEIESWLGTRGFRRIALNSAYHPTWGDALYLRTARGDTWVS